MNFGTDVLIPEEGVTVITGKGRQEGLGVTFAEVGKLLDRRQKWGHIFDVRHGGDCGSWTFRATDMR